MITLDKRLDKFLDSYEFYPNSVDFRIISSKAIEKFKNVQAFHLNEIRNGKYKFGATRREVLLLKFDILSRAVYEIENLCIQFYHDYENAEPEFVEYINKLIEKSRSIYNEIILDKHPEAFDPIFVNIWLRIINKDVSILLDGISELTGLPLIDFFIKLVNIVTRLIQNSTLGLYELDTMLIKQSHEFYTKSNCSPFIKDIHGEFSCGLFECKNFEICSTKDRMDLDNQVNLRVQEKLCIHKTMEGLDERNCLMLVISNYINDSTDRSLRHLESKMNIYKEFFTIDEIYFKNLSDNPINDKVTKKVEEFNIPIDYKRSIKS